MIEYNTRKDDYYNIHKTVLVPAYSTKGINSFNTKLWPWLGKSEYDRLDGVEPYWTNEPITGWRCIVAYTPRHIGSSPRLTNINVALGNRGPVACRGKGDGWSGLPHSGGPIPAATCTCGYYSYKTRDHVLQHIRDLHAYRAEPEEHTTLILKVENTGLTIEHERGYRSQRQSILSVEPLLMEEILGNRPNLEREWRWDEITHPTRPKW